MKIKLLSILIPISFLFFSASCGVSYPKETLVQDLEAKVFKETGVEAEVYSIGRTLYLDMELDDLVSQDQEKAYRAMMNMQSGLSLITRVVLSSDAEIKYMVVSAFDSNRTILFRSVSSINDVKDYFYYKISREDYLSRNLFEIEVARTASDSIEDRHDISDNEFVGRMIVSNVGMGSRNNPGLGSLISMLQLKYEDVDSEGNLIFSTVSDIDTKAEAVIGTILKNETRKYSQKYEIDFKKIKLLNRANNSVIEI